MSEKAHKVYNLAGMCNVIKDFDGKSLSTTEPKDIDEFFNLFTHRIEESLSHTPTPNLVKDVFEGKCSNEIIGIDCFHKSEKIENFYVLSLQIKNKSNITSSLASFIESERLEGANAYYCERCEKKGEAKKRITIKVLPNYLILVLKRFQYNCITGRKEKLNDRCEFPFELNMEEYSEEYNALKDIEENTETLINYKGEYINKHPKDYYQYNLKGVVLHLGNADSGHYISLIKDDEKKWFEFNDSKVMEFDVKRMPDEAFGGKVEASKEFSVLDSKHELFYKTKNAYLLIYERKSFYNLPELELIDYGKEEEMIKAHEQVKVHLKEPEIPQEISKGVIEESSKSSISQLILSVDFAKFMYGLIENCEITKENDYETLRKIDLQVTLKDSLIESWKFLSLYIFKVLLRTKENNEKNYYQILNFYKKALKGSTGLSIWLLETFCNQNIIIEFFITCPLNFARFFCYSSLIAAFNKVYPFEKEAMLNFLTKAESWNNYLTKDNKVVLPNDHTIPFTLILANNVFQVLLKLPDKGKVFKDLSFLLNAMCEISPEIRKLLLQYKAIGMTFEVIFDFEKMLPPETYDIPYVHIDKKLLLESSVVSELPIEKFSKSTSPKNCRFFLDMFAKLFLDCDLIGTKGYKPKEDEFFFLSCFYNKETVAKLFTRTTDKLSIEALSKVTVHLCTNNKEISAALINILFGLISSAKINEMYGYVTVLERMVSINDEFLTGRINFFVKWFNTLLNKYCMSYVTCTYLIDTFIRLALSCYFLKSKILTNPNDYKFIRVWLNENCYPGAKKVLC